MGVFRAEYASPRNANPQSGSFTFESKHPLNSKANEQDAPYRMLELFRQRGGFRGTSCMWNGQNAAEADAPVQMGLDFREPKKTRKRSTVERETL